MRNSVGRGCLDGWGGLDGRDQAEYARGHLRGAVNVGLQGRFAESVGIVLPPDRDIVLVGDAALGQESKTRLARVGFDRVVGQLRDLANVFTQQPDIVETALRFTAGQLAELLSLEPGLQLWTCAARGRRRTASSPEHVRFRFRRLPIRSRVWITRRRLSSTAPAATVRRSPRACFGLRVFTK